MTRLLHLFFQSSSFSPSLFSLSNDNEQGHTCISPRNKSNQFSFLFNIKDLPVIEQIDFIEEISFWLKIKWNLSLRNHVKLEKKVFPFRVRVKIRVTSDGKEDRETRLFWRWSYLFYFRFVDQQERWCSIGCDRSDRIFGSKTGGRIFP